MEQTSKILGRTKSTIRKYLNAGELKGEFTDDGWMVSRASVHARKENLERGIRQLPSQSAEDATEAIERLAMEVGKLTTMRELTSDSQAWLKEERDRLREALDEERERRIRAEAEIAFLKAPKPRSWVGRFFGL